MSKKNLVANLYRFVNQSFVPLFRSIHSTRNFEIFLQNFGWNLSGIMTTTDIGLFLQKVNEIFDQINSIDLDGLEDLDSIEFDKLLDVIKDFNDLNIFIRDLDLSELDVPTEILRDLLIDIPSSLFVHKLRFTKVFPILKFLDVIGYKGDNYNTHNAYVFRMQQTAPSLTYQRFKKLIADPKQYYVNKFFPQGINDYGTSNFVTGAIFEELAEILTRLGVNSFTRLSKFSILENRAMNPSVNQLYIAFSGFDDEDKSANSEIIFEHLPVHESLPKGLLIKAIGNINLSFPNHLFNVSLRSNLEFETILLHADGVNFLSEEAIDDFEIVLTVSCSDDNHLVLGSETQTRLKFGLNEINGFLKYYDGNWTWGVDANVKFDLVLTSSSEDSFINNVLGDEGLQVNLDLMFGYSERGGFYFGSNLNAGFERSYQINKTLFDFLTIHNVKAGLALNDSDFGTSFTTDISVRFSSAVVFTVSGIGLLAGVDFESETKNLGIGEFDLSFKKPNGIGVAIDFGPDFKGSGYLYINPPKYYGYLSLSIKSLQLDMLGILVTELPNDPDGYSFLALITMQFPSPIPLAFGFYLQGAGGIVGLHRMLSPDAFKEGVRSGELDQLFFPENIIENIDTILGQMESYFPVCQGRHSFGLLFDLTYGDSDMIRIELGLLVSVPQPILVAIAGTIKINAPDPNSPKVVLNCAFLGYYDSGKQLISFDARIYNSNIAGIGLEGDIAARLGWGNNKMFVISVGGFHPQFVPDTTWNIGNMNRMAVRLRDTDSLKIFVESYVAVTSNTFQIGAKGSLVYRGGGFEAEANTSFDALFYFNPFRFTVSISASAQVSWRSFDIAAVYVQGSISGPGIWNAKGSASFEVACFNPSFHFDVSWGNNNDQGLPPINVQEILEAELEKNSSWKGSGLQDKNVTYKQIESSSNEDTPLILAPHDSLTVNQLVVPLELNIQKFGENPVTGPTNFKIDSLEIGGTQFETAELVATEDYFAPNQFKSLNDQQRLQSASYEKLKSGATTNPSAYGIAIPIHNTAKEISYEQFYKGSEGELTQEPIQLLTSGDFIRQDLARGGALGRNREFRANKRKSNMKNKVRVVETEYSIVNKDTLIKYDNDIVVNSRTQALEILSNSNTIPSTEVSKLTVAPKFEHRNSVFVATENLGYDR